MFLYAGGDSFTYGDELFEEPGSLRCTDHAARIRCAWPGNLSKKLKISQHKNDAMGGSSNDRIFRKCIAFVSKWLADGKSTDELRVVIGWSSPERIEFKFCGEEGTYKDKQYEYIQFYRNILKVPYFTDHSEDVQQFFHLYDRNFNGDAEAKIRFVNQVISLQSILKMNKIRYMFFNAAWTVKPETEDEEILFRMVDPVRFFNFRKYDYNESMFGWIRNIEKLPLGPRLHPNAEGHAKWADRLLYHIEQNGIFE